MIAHQLYYDFSKEVERLKTNINTNNYNMNRDTQLLMKQVTMLREKVDYNNKEMDKRLNDLKKLMMMMSDQR